MSFQGFNIIYHGKRAVQWQREQHHMPFQYLFKEDNVIFVMALYEYIRVEPIKAYFAPLAREDYLIVSLSYNECRMLCMKGEMVARSHPSMSSRS